MKLRRTVLIACIALIVFVIVTPILTSRAIPGSIINWRFILTVLAPVYLFIPLLLAAPRIPSKTLFLFSIVGFLILAGGVGLGLSYIHLIFYTIGAIGINLAKIKRPAAQNL